MEMNMVLCMVVLGALAMATMLQHGTAQTAHVVGDNTGWTVPLNGADVYSKWASGKTFNVGDILVFNFATNRHDVTQVPKASFEACTSANAIGKPIMNGPANVTLDSAGEHYYICTVGKHCHLGQKLAITVTGNGAPSSPDSSSAPMVAGFLFTLASVALALFV